MTNNNRSTLYNFFLFYSKRKPYSRKGLEPLEEVSYDDFKNFIAQKRGRNQELFKESTLNNLYSHLAGFLKGLNINNKQFMQNRKIKIEEIPFLTGERDTSYFTKENVGFVLEKIDSNGKNRNRNRVIFYLLLYMGIEKSNILELKWTDLKLDVKSKKGTITLLDGQSVGIPEQLVLLLHKLQKEQKENGNTLGYVITTFRNGEYCIPNAGTINAIFAKLKNSQKEYEVFNPQYIRSSLPEVLLREGFSLEEICCLMNIKVSNILNYIPEKSIFEMGKEQLDRRIADGSIAKHPLIAVLDNYICQEESKTEKNREETRT